MKVRRASNAWNQSLELFTFQGSSPKIQQCLKVEELYYSARNKFERFRGFLELISRFEFEFCRCVNYFFEGFEFLVCSCECAVACLYPRNSISNVVASAIHDNTKKRCIYM